MDIELVARNYKKSLRTAADYIAKKRKDRCLHPAGKFDGQGRWYPYDVERQPCCDHIRRPTRKYPHSLNTHCRTKKHVYNYLGVSTLHV